MEDSIQEEETIVHGHKVTKKFCIWSSLLKTSRLQHLVKYQEMRLKIMRMTCQVMQEYGGMGSILNKI